MSGELVRIRFDHEYFGGPHPGLHLRWCESAAPAMREYGLFSRVAQDGIALRTGTSDSCPDPERNVVLRALGHCSDHRLLSSSSELPACGNVLYLRVRLGVGEISRETVPHREVPSIPGSASLRLPSSSLPVLVLDIESTAGELSFPARRSRWEELHVLLLRARRLRWKYYVSGDLADCCPEIHDVSAGSGERQAFRRAATPGPCGALAFLSEREIPLRQDSSLRLQLRNGANGRILLRRIPLASPESLGREVLEGGEAITVAQAFITP
jgi:hypothetical protein